jgi:cephalosporin hydroxylase
VAALRWDVNYVYSFSWFGRPIIQLPEDLVRMQETGNFALDESPFPFNESLITKRVTYCPNAYLKRLR